MQKRSQVGSPPMEAARMPLSGAVESPWCVFACGADSKNRFSFYENGRLHLSGDNGDLGDAENFGRYIDSVREMQSELGLSPDIVAHDLHPSYFSSRAGGIFKDSRRVGVQHHHAHIASVLAQSDSEETAIGVSFDGTGYGLDGNVWGGEFLLVSPRRWHRFGHFKYVKMPGGEKAVREPWRMAFALLYDHLGDELFDRDLPFMRFAGERACSVVKAMIDKDINAPLTSSCGRLFDAVSSLLDLTHVVRDEAEAAVDLEKRAAGIADSRRYRFDIMEGDDGYIVDYGPLLDEILSELEKGVAAGRIARRFHNSLAALIVDMARMSGHERRARAVVLSGGVFQNKLLRESAGDLLRESGFKVRESGKVPVNDLGICVGQTYVALRSVK